MSSRIALAASLAIAWLILGCGARSELDGFDEGAGGQGGTRNEPESCKEQGVTYIYVVMDDKRIFAFDPPSATFTAHGSLDCPDSNNAFSMAVNRKGVAFVELGQTATASEGHVYRVDTKNGSCEPTAYVPDSNFDSFGMGYTANTNNGGETLFLASGQGVLAKLNTTTFERTEVAPFSKALGEAELTGTADGRLFAFGLDITVTPHVARLAEVDPKSAEVLSDRVVPVGQETTAWAFANWGGDFYFFTTKNGVNSIVTKFDPEAHTFVHVATAPGRIVGSGVSTCAPL